MSERSTTLRTHFFSRKGDRKLTFKEFFAFIQGLQREVLRAEFLEYSRGLETISEEDFAKLLLRYTNLSKEARKFQKTFNNINISSFQEQDEYLLRLNRKLQDADKTGLSFSEVEQFFFLINHINDFSFAFRLYPLAGNKLDKKR